MKTMIIFATVCTLALSLAACQSAPTKTMAQANAAIAAAEKVNNKAKKVSFEWNKTGKIIKKAKKANKSGDFDKAVKLANKAERQAMYAVTQWEVAKPIKLYY